MKEELKNLIIKFQVSNMRTENLTNNIEGVRTLLKQYEYCLAKELETSNKLANKLELELLELELDMNFRLLMDDTIA